MNHKDSVRIVIARRVSKANLNNLLIRFWGIVIHCLLDLRDLDTSRFALSMTGRAIRGVWILRALRSV